MLGPRTRSLPLASIIALLACSTSLLAQRPARSPAADSAAAHGAAVAFLAAFDSLHWEPFRAYLADDVTMFFPFPDTPSRADGRAAVEARFKPFFEQGSAALARTGRTRQGLAPRDLRVQMAGDAAIVSFHLGTETPSRRSLVFGRNAAGAWKLVHWHASSAPVAPPPPAAAMPDSSALRGAITTYDFSSDVDGRSYPGILRLGRAPDGTWTAALSFPVAGELRVRTATEQAGEIRLTIEGRRGEGTFRVTPSEGDVRGSWDYGGKTGTVTGKRRS